MKKYLLLLISVVFCLSAASAQDRSDKEKMKEDLQKFKIDFIAREMNLSEKEKAEFTPIYIEYSRERRRAGSEAWEMERALKKKKDASAEEYKKLTELQQEAREKDNEIVKRYDAKLETFLNAKQIYQMHEGEAKFFDKMKEMRKKHGKPKHDKPRDKDKKHGDRPSRKKDSPCDEMCGSAD